MSRPRTIAVIAALIAWSPAPPPPSSPDDLASRVAIYRDTYGIPHVFGETDAATMFGFAYAQAEDNFWRLEDNYIRALGRRAELEGDRGLTSDRRNRALEIPRLAREEYTRMQPRMRALLAAFAQGLNAYLADHGEARPRLLTRFEPWYPLAFMRYNYYQSGFIWGAGLRPGDLETAPGELAAVKQFGSNGWVIGPAKSATGHAMLFINPQAVLLAGARGRGGSAARRRDRSTRALESPERHRLRGNDAVRPLAGSTAGCGERDAGSTACRIG
jgi:acyl-homoserine lactone acylase PvdQ